MKKIIAFILALCLFTGCSCGLNSASGAVKKYFNNYRNYDESVEKSLKDTMDTMSLTNDQKEKYEEIFKEQYKKLKYEIVDEKYDGDKATVDVKITVYDLYASQKESEKYLNDNAKEFETNGVYDTSKYIDYKLDEMKKQKETIEYNITVSVEKKDNKWQVIQLTNEDLQKINGTYAY